MRISVNADNREYSVQIGPGMIKEEGLFTGFRRAAVVTDETVAKLIVEEIPDGASCTSIPLWPRWSGQRSEPAA